MWYVGKAKNCVTRIQQHDLEQKRWAELAWSIDMPQGTGTVLHRMPTDSTGTHTRDS